MKDIEIIQHMKDGWELGLSLGYSPRAWLQKNGLGRGGESKNVSVSAVTRLRTKGTIDTADNKKGDNYSLRRYRLKE